MTARPHICIVYNQPILPDDHPDAASELEVLETVVIVDEVLTGAGMDVTRLAVGEDPMALVTGLRADPPDAVFNLFEGLADRPDTEPVVAGLMDWLKVPYTGCPADTLALARDKQRTKYLLHGAGLPTAPFFTVDRLPCPSHQLSWPLIVKPASLDASIGIDQDSVVTTPDQLDARVAFVLERYGPPALVEQFIPGREILASLVEGEQDVFVLPLAEISFRDRPGNWWPIYSYAAKWHEESSEYQSTPLQAPILLPDDWTDRIIDISKRAYRLLNCRDYARVDLRVTADGEPYILEVNPNPFINSIGLVNGLEAIGRTHSQFVVDLALAALSRRTDTLPARPARLGLVPEAG